MKTAEEKIKWFDEYSVESMAKILKTLADEKQSSRESDLEAVNFLQGVYGELMFLRAELLGAEK